MWSCAVSMTCEPVLTDLESERTLLTVTCRVQLPLSNKKADIHVWLSECANHAANVNQMTKCMILIIASSWPPPSLCATWKQTKTTWTSCLRNYTLLLSQHFMTMDARVTGPKLPLSIGQWLFGRVQIVAVPHLSCLTPSEQETAHQYMITLTW